MTDQNNLQPELIRIGTCGWCDRLNLKGVGNKPGPHHEPNCPAYRPEELKNEQ